LNWDDLKIFLAIANEGGLKKAASKLSIHHTSCARRIKSLETDLGVKLFDRLPSGYVLTDAGEQLYQSSEVIHKEFNAIECQLQGKDLRLEGDLCLTLPLGFATNLLMPDIRYFLDRYPDVHLKIKMTYSFRDLASREADVAIRHVENPPDSLAGRCLGHVYYSAYASSEYLASHDLVNKPELCHWLGWGDAKDHLKWAEKSKYPDIPIKGDFYSDIMQLEAIKQHMGVASLPCFLADNVPGISRIPNAEVSPRDCVWVLAHKDMMRNAKVRTLIDFIFKSFKQHQHKIKGLK